METKKDKRDKNMEIDKKAWRHRSRLKTDRKRGKETETETVERTERQSGQRGFTLSALCAESHYHSMTQMNGTLA